MVTQWLIFFFKNGENGMPGPPVVKVVAEGNDHESGSAATEPISSRTPAAQAHIATQISAIPTAAHQVTHFKF